MGRILSHYEQWAPNARLQTKVDALLNPNTLQKREVYHRAFMYQAASWTKARRGGPKGTERISVNLPHDDHGYFHTIFPGK